MFDEVRVGTGWCVCVVAGVVAGVCVVSVCVWLLCVCVVAGVVAAVCVGLGVKKVNSLPVRKIQQRAAQLQVMISKRHDLCIAPANQWLCALLLLLLLLLLLQLRLMLMQLVRLLLHLLLLLLQLLQLLQLRLMLMQLARLPLRLLLLLLLLLLLYLLLSLVKWDPEGEMEQ